MSDVTFFMSDADAVERYGRLDPDRDWQHFASGIPCWIAQTYLRLRAAGNPVALTATAPRRGTVVVHADDLHAYLHAPAFSDRCLIVCVRADRQPQRYADVEIVQNAASADGPRVLYMPHWPQPGLVPRDPTRGSRLENVAFKGSSTECHPMFESADWARFVERQHLNWVADQAIWKGPRPRAYDETRWNDYSDTDLVIGIRPDATKPYLNKPASKLVNAWLAGVPAILGPEVAYRELRKSPLDYIEVRTVRDVIDAVAALRDDPRRYLAMVQNGLERAQAFLPEVVTRRWQNLLFGTVVELQDTLHWMFLKHVPTGLRRRIRNWQEENQPAPPPQA